MYDKMLIYRKFGTKRIILLYFELYEGKIVILNEYYASHISGSKLILTGIHCAV